MSDEPKDLDVEDLDLEGLEDVSVPGGKLALMRRVMMVHDALMEGHTSVSMVGYLKDRGVSVSDRTARRYIKTARELIAARFSKDFEQDFMFVKENMLRLFREAAADGNRKEQLNILKELVNISGLSEAGKVTGFTVNTEDIDTFIKLF